METMIPPQVGMRLRTKKIKKIKKEKGQIKKGESPKKEKKGEKKEQCYYPFSTLVLQSSTMFFMIECLLFCHFHILVGIFIIELGLHIPMMGFLKMP